MRLLVGGHRVEAGEARTDLTVLCLGLAERFHEDGYEHPVAAALAVAARGLAGLEPAAFAERHGWDEATVRATESGLVGFADLPAGVGDLLMASRRFDLLQLADLERCRLPRTLEPVWEQASLPGMAEDQPPRPGRLMGG